MDLRRLDAGARGWTTVPGCVVHTYSYSSIGTAKGATTPIAPKAVMVVAVGVEGLKDIRHERDLQLPGPRLAASISTTFHTSG